ncbi:MAG: HD domain-containing protein [bacterium]|nr:HD domain-containing protein [bacterium]
MKKQFIEQLRDGETIGDFFVVAECERKTTGANKAYLSLVLSDGTGRAPAVAWDNIDRLASILQPGTIVRIEGAVGSYKGGLQIKITDARSVKPSDRLDPSDFVPKTPHDVEHLYRQLLACRDLVLDRHLRALLDAFFTDPEFAARFKEHPAAKRMHHAYRGGLLEHTVSVAHACLRICEHYSFLNRDVLLTGALLHDVGKLAEMAGEIVTDYTTYGQLVGHLNIGCEMIAKAVDKIPDFPDILKWQIQHMILSHHGEYEFGAAVLPATLEALTLHYLDVLDAHLFQARAAVEDEQEEPGDFTKRVYGLERCFYKRGLKEKGTSPAAPSAPLAGEPDLLKEVPGQETLL